MLLSELEEKKLTDLYKLAKEYQIPYYSQLKKKELIFAILRARAERDGLMFMEGVLEILPEATDSCALSTTSELGGHLHLPVADSPI